MALSKTFNYLDFKTPITALRVHEDLLLSGSGSILEVWSIKETGGKHKPITSLRCKVPPVIHGIYPFDRNGELLIVISGLAHIAIVKMVKPTNETENYTLSFHTAAIYLKGIVMAVKHCEDKLYTVLSDNTVKVVDLETYKASKPIKSPLECIIYSATILKITPKGHFMVATGTPFRITDIWAHWNKGLSGTIANLEDHTGAIFALEYDHNNNLLFTASDDRCINVYLHEIQSLDDSTIWNKSKFTLCHRFYSHESRIWSMVSLNGHLISCGENEELCVFSPHTGNLVIKTKSREVSTLWCLAASKEKSMVYIGSDDSSIRMYPLNDKLKPTHRANLLFDSTYVKSMSYLRSSSSGDELICVTSDACCSHLYFNGELPTVRKTVYLGLEFASYCLTCIDGQDTLYCANLEGSVKVLELPSLKEIVHFTAYEGKIHSLLPVNDNKIVTSGPEGSVKLWKRDVLLHEFKLEKCRHRWVTCCLMLDEHLITGDGGGNISIFTRGSLWIKQCFYKAHSNHGVNDIKLNPVSGAVYSCGRDGKVHEYVWDKVFLTKTRELPFNIGFDWIERIFFDSDNNVSLIGFEGDNFVVWQQVDQSIMWSVNCGGGHRLWDFNNVNSTLNFCFNKKSELFFASRPYTLNEVSDPYIKPKFQSKKINCCCLIDDNSTKALIASGSEDNSVLISSFDLQSETLQTVDYLKGHISSVRTLATTKQPGGSVLLVSAGGQSQFMVWSLKMNPNGVVITQIYNSHSVASDQTAKKSLANSEGIITVPIACYQSADIRKLNFSENSYMITLIRSDSFLQIFTLVGNQVDLIEQVSTGNYAQLTSKYISDFLITGSTNGALNFWMLNKKKINWLLNGSVTKKYEDLLLKDEKAIAKLTETSSHIAGINSIDCKYMKDNLWLIFSSGDSGVLHADLASISESGIVIKASTKTDFVHSSKISAVSILDDRSLVTCSIDHRIRLWNYSVDYNSSCITIIPIRTSFFSVADISSSTILATNSHHYLIITGAGMEILKISE